MIDAGGDGRLVVLGSSLVFSDAYIDKEENSGLSKMVLSFLFGEPLDLHQMDADEPDVAEYNIVSNIADIAERPRVCLQRPAVVRSQNLMRRRGAPLGWGFVYVLQISYEHIQISQNKRNFNINFVNSFLGPYETEAV